MASGVAPRTGPAIAGAKKGGPDERQDLLTEGHALNHYQKQEGLVVYVLQISQLHPSAAEEGPADQQTRWKGIAICEELEPLKPHVKNANRRIIDRESLAVVYPVKK
jgi:hypothetical protein